MGGRAKGVRKPEKGVFRGSFWEPSSRGGLECREIGR